MANSRSQLTSVAVFAIMLTSLHSCVTLTMPAPLIDRSGSRAETEATTFENLGLSVSVLAAGLDTPWDLAWGPDDHLWVTERVGRVLRINPSTGVTQTVATVSSLERGESGLMGMAFHPDFDHFPFVYLALSYSKDGEIANKLIRMRYDGMNLGEEEVLLSGIDGAIFHDGSRLAVGPDNLIYMTTGDARQSDVAQDTDSLSGKILRLDLDGQPVADNPFGNEIYSLGHRNPQGLVFHPVSGDLYITEHGPQDNDEVSIIVSGGNYGWPAVRGFVDDDTVGETAFDQRTSVVEPIASWTPTIAPAGADFYQSGTGAGIDGWDGDFLFTTLKGGSLIRLELSPDGQNVIRQHTIAEKKYGRLRDVAVGPDGTLYLATSNRDGRGQPAPEDDRILVISR